MALGGREVGEGRAGGGWGCVGDLLRKLANLPRGSSALSSTPSYCTLLCGLLTIQGNDGHFYLLGPARLHIYTIGDNQTTKPKALQKSEFNTNQTKLGFASCS